LVYFVINYEESGFVLDLLHPEYRKLRQGKMHGCILSDSAPGARIHDLL